MIHHFMVFLYYIHMEWCHAYFKLHTYVYVFYSYVVSNHLVRLPMSKDECCGRS